MRKRIAFINMNQLVSHIHHHKIMVCMSHKNLCQLIVNSESICTVIGGCGVFCFFVVLCCWGLTKGLTILWKHYHWAVPVMSDGLFALPFCHPVMIIRLLCTGSAMPLLFLSLSWYSSFHVLFSEEATLSFHLKLYVHVCLCMCRCQ